MYAALSSTRVMATCSLLGQAVACTTAALCVEKQCLPTEISSQKIQTRQTRLLEDDCWLPGKTRPLRKLMQATQVIRSKGESTDARLDGHEREAD